jgi:superfamily II DNA or RNA helicase
VADNLRDAVAVPEVWADIEDSPGLRIRQLLSLGGLCHAGPAEFEDKHGRRWPLHAEGGGSSACGHEGCVRLGASAGAWQSQPAGSLETNQLADRIGEAFDIGVALGHGESLRRPQKGALMSILSFQTTGVSSAATVVMPTGTGKTETMLAAYAALSPACLLVIVPTDALRAQIAEKFETFGVLKAAGVLDAASPYPIVARVLGRIESEQAARDLAKRSNVIVSTAAALARVSDATRHALSEECDALFIDEAHHIPAATWSRIRNSFNDRPIVQFTATPYRRDGKRLGGDIIYSFPLREAQKDGHFAKIKYVGVFDLVEPDRAVAEIAVRQLRDDVEKGLNHLLMARAATRAAARELLAIYRELAAEFRPVMIVSGGRSTDRDAAFTAIESRESRIIVCVDMLGEGYDLPNLKVAAIHNPHRSLGITLQFVGRFARKPDDPTIGDATIIAPRTEVEYDANLRRLYAEDADWNKIIEELSSAAVGAERDLDEFDRGFTQTSADSTVRSIAPKISCVVYRTDCTDWNLPALENLFPDTRLLTNPINVNFDRRVIWFISEERQTVQWGDAASTEDVTHDLYAIYWDSDRGLLYINSSGNAGLYRDIAAALCGESVQIYNGDAVYRTLAKIDRPVPTNIGVLDTRNSNRRFSMHVGADVTEGLPAAQSETKTQTNIFVSGYEGGEKVGAGISLKGRLWRRQAAPTLQHWVKWCDFIGSRLLDLESDVAAVLAGLIRPVPVKEWPALPVLAVEWPLEIALDIDENHRLSLGGVAYPLLDIELSVASPEASEPVVRLNSPSWSAEYSVVVTDEGLRYQPLDADARYMTSRGSGSFASFLAEHGLRFILADDAIVEPPGFLLKPNRTLPPFDTAKLTALSWDGINIHNESQGQDRDSTSIQYRILNDLQESDEWDVIIDDDGSGEVADCVSIAIRDEALVIRLTHCKYSSEDSPGARVGDLYEVCGQAMKSVVVRRDPAGFFARLIKRERQRVRRGARSGFIIGTPDQLLNIRDSARLLRPRLEIQVVQPGLSASKVSDAQLNILAGAHVYIAETANASFDVLCSD